MLSKFVEVSNGISVKNGVEKAVFGYIENKYYPAFATKVNGTFIVEKDYSSEGIGFYEDLMETILPIIKKIFPNYNLKKGMTKNSIVFCNDTTEKTVWFFRKPFVLNEDWKTLLNSNFIENGAYIFINERINEEKLKKELEKILK